MNEPENLLQDFRQSHFCGSLHFDFWDGNIVKACKTVTIKMEDYRHSEARWDGYIADERRYVPVEDCK